MTTISTTHTTEFILSSLRVSETSSVSNLDPQNVSNVQLSNSVNISDAAHTLILKDKIATGAQMMSFVTVSTEALNDINGFLTEIKDKVLSISSNDFTEIEIQAINEQITQLENEMSGYIGRLYHENNLDIILQTYDQEIDNNFAEIINLQDDEGENLGSITAIEVNFSELISNIHAEFDENCPHCTQKLGTGQQISTLAEQPLETSITSSSTGYQNVTGATGDTNQEIIDTLLLGTKWDVDTANGETLTYSYFDADTAGYSSPYNGTDEIPVVTSPTEVNDVDPNNETDLNSMFQLWDDVLGISFSEINEQAGSDAVGEIRVAFTDQQSNAAAFAYQPGGSPVNGDVWFELEDNVGFDPSGVGADGYSFRSALHEVGHAIGLSHPFDQSSVSGATLSTAEDIQRNTFMSYTNIDRNLLLVVKEEIAGVTTSYTMNELENWNRTPGSSVSYGTISVSASTPMPYDILAGQFLYGASNDTRVDDTTYSFDVTPYTIETIYDSDGSDTIDASNQTNGSYINLEPGSFSSIGQFSVAQQMALLDTKGLNTQDTVQDWLSTAYDNVSSALANDMNIDSLLYTGADNVAIAYGVEIENAYGGAGDDTILGNSLNNYLRGGDGDDIIRGGEGNDTILLGNGDDEGYGGAGNDLFIYAGTGRQTFDGGSGSDTVKMDFSGFQAGQVIEFNLATGRSGIVDTPHVNDDTLIDIENIWYAGSTDTIMVGNDANNVFIGGAGVDTVDGGLGSDDTMSYAKSHDDFVVLHGAVTTLSVQGNHAANQKIGFSLTDENGNIFSVSVTPTDTRTVEVAKSFSDADIVDANGNVTINSGFIIEYNQPAPGGNGATIIIHRDDEADFSVALLNDNHVDTQFGIEGRIRDGATELTTAGYQVKSTQDGDLAPYTVVIEDHHGTNVPTDVTAGFDRLANIEFIAYEEASATSATLTLTDVIATDLSAQAETFDISVDGGETVTVTLNQIDYTSGNYTWDDFALELQTQINSALSAAGQTTTSVAASANSPIQIVSSSSGSNSSIEVSNLSPLLQTAVGASDANGTGLSYIPGVDAGEYLYYDVENRSFTTTAPNVNLSAGGATDPNVPEETGNSTNSSSNTSSNNSTKLYGTISAIDLSTADGAQAALSIIDNALEQLNDMRSNMGALSNRLAHIISNLSNQVLNTETSQSRIEDADMAVEMSRFVKAQVLQQAAMQVLGRAQQNSRTALTILNG